MKSLSPAAPHPDFSNQLHTVTHVIGIMDDSTVIYEGFYYAKPGENPKPLGGLGVSHSSPPPREPAMRGST